jgi:hypothetical protein
MWLITFLPDAMVALVVYTIIAVGAGLIIASMLTRWIPAVAAYRTPLQVFGAIVLMFGIYLQGGRANEAEWQARVQELELKLAQSQVDSQKKNVEIQTQVVTKTRVVREKGNEIIKYIDRFNDREVLKEISGPERVRVEEVIRYIEKCPVPKEIIDAHNAAAVLNQAAQGGKQ